MKILVVDDERSIRFSLVELLEEEGHDVREAEHAPAALAALEDAPADLVISDLSMPAMSGLQLLEEVRAATRHALRADDGARRRAAGGARPPRGRVRLRPKPFDNEEIRAIARRARELLALRAENVRLREELGGAFRGLIGDSPALRQVQSVVRRAAPTDATVLITGESGTGKEVVARALHAESRRGGAAFVAINCSPFPAS
jgi:DNA-binding NtrC family response regulator